MIRGRSAGEKEQCWSANLARYRPMYLEQDTHKDVDQHRYQTSSNGKPFEEVNALDSPLEYLYHGRMER